MFNVHYLRNPGECGIIWPQATWDLEEVGWVHVW